MTKAVASKDTCVFQVPTADEYAGRRRNSHAAPALEAIWDKLRSLETSARKIR
jgi:hypothetical protein